MYAFNPMVIIPLQLLSFSQILADVKTSPKRIMKLKGDAAVLRCLSTSSIPNYPIQWTHRKVGASVAESSFVYFEGQLYESYNHGRHSVVLNESLKTCDLVIKHLSLDDAGSYRCAHVLESSEYSDIELAILESLPRCSSNISLTNVLVDNDCGLTPDYIDLVCQIGYRGNIAPVLQWSHSAKPYIILSTSSSQPQAKSVTFNNLPLKPHIEMNDTYYICSVYGPGLDTGVLCETLHTRIAYMFKPSAISDTGNIASCIANTSSQNCTYRWIYAPSNGSMETSGRTMILGEHLNHMRCEIECDIRGVKCTVTSDVLSGTTMKNEGRSSEPGMNVGLVLGILALAIVIILVILMLKPIRHRLSSLIRCVRGQRQNGFESELRQLLPIPQEAIAAFDGIDPTTERYSTLVECLDAVNGLADQVYSKQLLKDNEYQLLTNVSSYEKQAVDLLEMLIPMMDNEERRKEFLEAVIESDQRHVYNFLIHSTDTSARILNKEELKWLQSNYAKLREGIESTDSFLDQLVENRCITVHQCDRIKQQTSKIDRNRELIMIMKRRSSAKFVAFNDLLRTKQSELVQTLDSLPGQGVEDQQVPNGGNWIHRVTRCIGCWIGIISLFGNLRLIGAEVKTSPNELIKLIGDSAVLHCISSSNPRGSLQWKHLQIGASAHEAEYVLFDGQFFEPYDGGRHSVVFEESPKTSDLSITKLTLDDAGKYICSNVLNTTDYSDIELTILESPPCCRTNISLNNLLVDNDCNLTLDYFELNCSVGYRGKVAPVLLWSHSSQPDIVLSTSNSQPQSNKVTSLSHPMKPAYDMNGTYFICSIEGVGEGEGVAFEPDDSACSTQNITVDYIFPPKATRLSSSVDRATCIANTSSERCNYRWRGKHLPSNSTIESYDQILQLDEHMSNLRCATECEIHGQTCTVISHFLPEMTADVETGYFAYQIIPAAVVGVIVIGVLLAIAVFLFLLKGKSFFSGFRRRPTQNGCKSSEQRVLLNAQNVSDNFIQEHFSTLMACLDAVNGLPDELYSRGILTEDECDPLENESSYEKRTETLLNILKPRMGIESEKRFFLEALRDTDQEHVCEYLIHFKDKGRNTSNRILGKSELNCIQRNFSNLLNLIKSNDSFLDLLFKYRCITERQKERIKQFTNKRARNRELLAIMKRRSFAHFEAFKTVLTKTKQHNLVRILNDMHGSVAGLHCVLDMENQSKETIKEVEQHICDSINDPHLYLSYSEQQYVSSQLRPLTDNGVELVGASPTGSIYLYFLCKTLEAVTIFKQSYDSGDLKQLVESVLNTITTKSSNPSAVEISIGKTKFQRIVREIRENMYYSKATMQSIRPSFTLLPEEMLKLILQKSFVRSWSTALKSYAPEDIETGGYALLQKFVSSEGKVVYINLMSVMFKWKDTCSVQGLFRLAIIKRLRECKNTLIRGLNCQYGLLASLVDAGGINPEEEEEISGVSTESKDKFLPSCMSASNERLIECISDKSFTEMKIFLKQMDKTNLGHLLNYMFCSKKLTAFNESWPLEEVTMDCIVNRKNQLIKANISITENTIGYVSATHPEETLPRGMSLLDILSDRGCISSTHKRFIQEQTTDELRRAALFQMLATGSIKAYKTTVAYLRDTNQYVDLVQHILVPGGKEITKVAWLENKIYVVCYKSTKIYVYSDEEPFDRLEEEEIDISGILLPYDIAACNQHRIIYISDRVNKSLWKIQLYVEGLSPKLLNKSVDGEPIDLFIMSSGDLLLTVEHETRRRLEIYSPEDLNRPQAIDISADVHHAWHAVQLSTGTFVVASRSIDTIRVGRAYFLQEISGEGEVLRKFESIFEHESITPFHLSVDNEDNILFCDALKKAVYVVDPEWKELKMLLTEEKHGVKEAERLCLVPKKNLLVIGNRSSIVSIFNLENSV